MGLLGDTTKAILLLAVLVRVFLIFKFIAMNQIALAMLLLIGLIIPFLLIALEYRKHLKEFQCLKFKYKFKVSQLRLIFTQKFRGRDPPTATVAYYLECHECGDKAWLIPSG
jgi:hypothetical protein